MKHDIDREIAEATAAHPATSKRPPAVTIGSWWFNDIWGVVQVLSMQISWCGDTEVRLWFRGNGRGYAWWEAKAFRQTFSTYSQQPCPYSDKARYPAARYAGAR